MNNTDKKRLYELLEARYAMFNREMSRAMFDLWLDDLNGYSIHQIEPALKQAGRGSRFAPVPADVLILLPDLSGHVTREIAWNICPKTPFDGNYVTDEIMQARGTCQDSIEGGDRMARMAFLEAYDQILANARVHNKKAVWWYTEADGGTHKQRSEQKLQKTLEAAACGRLTEQRATSAVQLICDSSGNDSTPYLKQLPGAKSLPTLPPTSGSPLIGNQ